MESEKIDEYKSSESKPNHGNTKINNFFKLQYLI